MASTDLPDINVWIALSAPDHEHRARADRYWHEEAAPRLAITTVTMLGIARVCSAAPIFAGHALTPGAAWGAIQGWLGYSQVAYLYEPEGCRNRLDALVSAGLVTHRTWTDAYLAAFAMAAGLRLVSFDSDFRRFPDLYLLHLTP